MSGVRARYSIQLALFSTMLLMTANATAREWTVSPFEAKYNVKVGVANATSVVTLQQLDSERFEIVSTTRVTGLIGLFKRGKIDERAVFRVVDGEILAESLVRNDRLSPEERSCEVRYRPEDGEATVTFKGNENIIEMPRNTLNPLLLQIALTQDMAGGGPPDAYTTLDHAGLKKFEATVGEQKTIKTPNGQYNAIPIDLINPEDQSGTRMWAAVDDDYMAIQVEARKDGEVKATLKLTSLTVE